MGKGIRTKVELIGTTELKRFLDEYPKRVVKKGLRAAANAGGTPIVKALRRNARSIESESGAFRKSIGKKVKSYRTGNAIALIGANKATEGSFKGRRRVPSFYWHLILGGAKAHDVGSGRKHPGFKGRDILGDAVASTVSQVRSAMTAKLAEVMTKEAAKLASK